MSNRNEAIRLLKDMCVALSCPFYESMDKNIKGKGVILGYLAQSKEEVLAGDLAKMMGVSTARIAALLRIMEKDGLITRSSSAKDARRTIVEITPAGIELANELVEQSIQKMELLLDEVGKEDLEEFIRIAEKIKISFCK